jgi:penicillin-binding protein 2
MAAVLIRPSAHKSRLRLVVLQVLMLSLFVTLFARLWYLQVLSGEVYQARAAEQSVRELVVQPPRGLIVDAMGRPLVANRASWVVSADRSVLAGMADDERTALLRRVARIVDVPVRRIEARLVLCGRPGAQEGICWNGSPYQPVPIAQDVSQGTAVMIREQAEDYPGIIAQTESLRSYPSPFGINAAGLLGYLSPITAGELEEAEKEGDDSVNGASVVGRAGLEKSYDTWLRGRPGYKKVAVDSMGHVLGDSGEVSATAGDTLVTSIDARLQGFVEKQLHQTLVTARHTFDKVTGKNYVADSGAVVVMEARTGRLVAMASEPTYDPSVWVGGITSKQLKALYSEKNGTPLVQRALQGQFAPGSTWKPIMTVGALNNGFTPDTRLDCSSGLQVGNRWFKNYESASYGYIDFARALQLSCDTFFYRVGLKFWHQYGSDPENVNAKDPLVAMAKSFGFGKPTGIDLPGEAAGRIADRHWKLAYWKALKDQYCEIDRKDTAKDAFTRVYAHEFCLEGNYYRASDAVNYAIGQGDTMVTPLQLARAYAALSNGGTLFAPRVAKAVVDPQGKVVKRIKPKVAGHVKSSKAALRYVDEALKGTPRDGTLAWKFIGFPLDQVQVRGKTGSAEVYGKQSTSWVATYSEDYVVVMMVTQGGTGSGTSGPAVRAIWEKLYGVDGPDAQPNPRKAVIPGVTQPRGLPVFTQDGSILPPRSTGGMS